MKRRYKHFARCFKWISIDVFRLYARGIPEVRACCGSSAIFAALCGGGGIFDINRHHVELLRKVLGVMAEGATF